MELFPHNRRTPEVSLSVRRSDQRCPPFQASSDLVAALGKRYRKIHMPAPGGPLPCCSSPSASAEETSPPLLPAAEPRLPQLDATPAGPQGSALRLLRQTALPPQALP